MPAAPKTDWLVFGADALSRAQTVKASSWNDAASQVVSAQNIAAGEIVCVPTSAIQKVVITSQPQLSINPA